MSDPTPPGGFPAPQAAAPEPGDHEEPAGERTDLRAELEAREAAPAPCPACGSAEPADAEGACPACGAHRPVARDHVEMPLGAAAAVSDRGLRRRRNEDAVELGRHVDEAGETWVAVVCDGVASARRGDMASLAAVGAAVTAGLQAASTPTDHGAIEAAIEAGPPDADPAVEPARDLGPDSPGQQPSGSAGPGAALGVVASAASQAAVAAAAELGRGGGDNPACTYVAAVVRGGDAVVSWIGDSRAYWLAGDGSARLLSTDDSWAEEIAAAGLMSREEAAHDRRAHVLTRWLGLDAPSGPAHARRIRLGVPGLLLLCSDGLWNHVPDAEVLARLALNGVAGAETAGEHPAMGGARALLTAALEDGGHDNTTIALVPVTPPADDAQAGQASVTVDAGPEERTGPIPLHDPGGS